MFDTIGSVFSFKTLVENRLFLYMTQWQSKFCHHKEPRDLVRCPCLRVCVWIRPAEVVGCSGVFPKKLVQSWYIIRQRDFVFYLGIIFGQRLCWDVHRVWTPPTTQISISRAAIANEELRKTHKQTKVISAKLGWKALMLTTIDQSKQIAWW